MADERLTYFLTQIYSTQGAEIDCRRLQSLLPAYVEHDLSNGNGTSGSSISEDQLAAVQNHLDHCPDCDDVYQVLRQVVSLTSTEDLPDVEDLLADFEERTEHDHAQSQVEMVRCSG